MSNKPHAFTTAVIGFPDANARKEPPMDDQQRRETAMAKRPQGVRKPGSTVSRNTIPPNADFIDLINAAHCAGREHLDPARISTKRHPGRLLVSGKPCFALCANGIEFGGHERWPGQRG